MATVRVQWIWKHRSGLDKDHVTNTFHFVTADAAPDAGEGAEILDQLARFWTVATPSGSALYPFLSRELSGVYQVKMYDLGQPEPRAPFYTAEDNVGAFSGTPDLPGEVAAVLTYHGAPKSGVPFRRRRGRIFIGPLDGTAMTTAANTPPRVSSSFIQTVNEAAERLAEETEELDVVGWVVHSQYATAGDAGLGDGNSAVVGGWVDNAFDTVRSRGVQATAKTLWSATP